MRWSSRLISVSHLDIYWCSWSLEDVIIIDHCGEFHNVPLLGIRIGITYNPCLALRQFGYARRDVPHEMIIQGVVFNYKSDNQGYHQRFIRAWRMVSKVDSKTWDTRIPFPFSLTLGGYELLLRNLWCLITPSYQLSWKLWLKEMSRTLSSIPTCLLLFKTCKRVGLN